MSATAAEPRDVSFDEWIELAYDVQSRDPRWIPPLRESTRRWFGPANPLLRTVEHRLFLERDQGGRAAARCAAFVNPRLRDGDDRPIGQIGFFEARDDERPARALLDGACAWLRERGAARIWGPINGSTYHPYRLAISGFDGPPPYIFEPWNPPYYPRLFERAGFAPCATYFSSEASNRETVEIFEPKVAAARAAGYTIERAPVADLERVLRTIHDLSVKIFAGNFGYSEIAYDEFRSLYEGIERFLEPGLVHFAYDAKGAPAGFGFGYPDFGDALRALRGRLSIAARLRFVLARRFRRPAATVSKTFGVVAEARKASLGSALVCEVSRGATALGIDRSIHALLKDDNPSRIMSENLRGRRFREYALYELAAP